MTAVPSPKTRAPLSALGRILAAVGALSLDKVIAIVGQIAIVPIALSLWGEAKYGEWLVLTGLVSLLAMSDFGMQTYVVNRICECHSKGNLRELHHILHSTMRVHLPLVALLIAISALAICFGPLVETLGIQTTGSATLRAVVLILVIDVLHRVPMGVVSGLYRATGYLARAAIVQTVQNACTMLATIALIYFSCDFYIVAGARLLISLATTAWTVTDLRRILPWLQLFPTTGCFRDGITMLKPAFFFLLIPLANFLSAQSIILVIQHSIDSSEVSRFATHRTVMNLAMMLCGIVSLSIWPELTRLNAQNDKSALIQVHRSYTKLNAWMVAMILIILFPALRWIYPTWTAGRLAIDQWTFIILAARLVLWGAWSASSTLLMSINRHKRLAMALLGAALLSATFSTFMVPYLGIRGGALALLLGDVLVVVWLSVTIACGETEDRLWEFTKDVTWTLGLGVLAPLGAGLIAWQLVSHELARYLIVVPSTALLSAVSMWFLLSQTERAFIQHLRKTLRGRLKPA